MCFNANLAVYFNYVHVILLDQLQELVKGLSFRCSEAFLFINFSKGNRRKRNPIFLSFYLCQNVTVHNTALDTPTDLFV